MIDTHSHIYEFPDGGVAAMERALAIGVSHVVLPNVDADTIAPIRALHSRFPENTTMAIGLHPTDLGEDWKTTVADMERLISGGGYRAIGEVGIDLYWDKTRLQDQLEAFAEQIRIADRFGLPVIIHCREALDETLSVIRALKPKVKLVFHSFTGGSEEVKKVREVCDPMFGINGVVTFKNAQPLRDALSDITLDNILLETDSPYLAPVPYRGKKNESSYLPLICAQVADVLGVSVEEVDRKTSQNAVATFSL